jgi:hypothetical protein
MSITINNQIFSTINSTLKYIDENNIDTEVTELEEIFNKGGELVEAELISPENRKILINAYIDKEDINYHKAYKELTLTSDYHSWINTVADQVRAATEDLEEGGLVTLEPELLARYNSLVRDYNKYGDLAPLSQGMSVKSIFEAFLRN